MQLNFKRDIGQWLSKWGYRATTRRGVGKQGLNMELELYGVK